MPTTLPNPTYPKLTVSASRYVRPVYRYGAKKVQLLVVCSSQTLVRPALPDADLAHGSRAVALISDDATIPVFWHAKFKAFVTEDPCVGPVQ